MTNTKSIRYLYFSIAVCLGMLLFPPVSFSSEVGVKIGKDGVRVQVEDVENETEHVNVQRGTGDVRVEVDDRGDGDAEAIDAEDSDTDDADADTDYGAEDEDLGTDEAVGDAATGEVQVSAGPNGVNVAVGSGKRK